MNLQDHPIIEGDAALSVENVGSGGDELPTLSDLPKELGVLLASVGVLGVVLPGIAGAPALLAGGLVLWPRTFGKVEDWFRGKYPESHRASMRQVGRFLDDLDGRYPHSRKSQP
jgi:hypothetical protein